MHHIVIAAAVLTVLCQSATAETFTFGEGENQFQMEFVHISSPGNPDDADPRLPESRGGVDYEYQIAKFETTCSQAETAQQLGAFREQAINFCLDDGVGPTRIGTDYALEFVNWLNTSEGLPPAYALGQSLLGEPWPEDHPGYNPEFPYRNSGARYFLPTTDEYYKAAFYDPVNEVYYDYATGSDEAPSSVAGGTLPGTAVFCIPNSCAPTRRVDVQSAGGLSPFGTMGQLGNASEWEEGFGYFWAGVRACQPDLACLNGEDGISSWNSRHPHGGIFSLPGFRVVALNVPEPSTVTLVLLGLLAISGARRSAQVDTRGRRPQALRMEKTAC